MDWEPLSIRVCNFKSCSFEIYRSAKQKELQNKLFSLAKLAKKTFETETTESTFSKYLILDSENGQERAAHIIKGGFFNV